MVKQNLWTSQRPCSHAISAATCGIRHLWLPEDPLAFFFVIVEKIRCDFFSFLWIDHGQGKWFRLLSTRPGSWL
jgi:hypothetical protein